MNALPDHLEYGVRKQNGFETCLTNSPSVTVLEGSVCEWGGAKNFLGAFCFLLKSTNYAFSKHTFDFSIFRCL